MFFNEIQNLKTVSLHVGTYICTSQNDLMLCSIYLY